MAQKSCSPLLTRGSGTKKYYHGQINICVHEVKTCKQVNRKIFKIKKICYPMSAVVIIFLWQKLLCGNVCFSNMGSLSAALSETLQRCSSMKYGASVTRYSFRIALLNIFRKSLGKHQRQSSYTSYYELSILCCHAWFSSWKLSEQQFQKKQLRRHFWYCVIVL